MRCSIGALTAATAIVTGLCVLPGSAGAASTRWYGGSTGRDDTPMTMAIKGSRIVRAARQYRTDCGPWSVRAPVKAHIRKGRFHSTIEYAALVDGDVLPVIEEMRGRVTKGRVTGTVRL